MRRTIRLGIAWVSPGLARRLAVAVLAAALLAGPAAHAQELLQNGDFESGADGWSGCGGVDATDLQDPGVTAAMVRAGRFAARVGGPSNGGCGSLPAAQLVLVQPVTIPADAGALTLSFWFSRLGAELVPDGNTVADLAVSLTSDPSLTMTLLGVVSHNALRSWTPFHGTLAPDDLAAFRGQTAYLRFAVQYTGDTDVTYASDDVSLVAADVHTQGAPLPAALSGDGTRPLVLLQANGANPDGLTVVRLDTDGTKPLAVDTGLYHRPRLPRWSPDGSAIAVVDDDLSPHDAAAGQVQARISRLSVVRPDGSERRELFATQGLPGTPGMPPGCAPPECVDPPGPALDQVIRGVEWSADGRVLMVTVCIRNRYASGDAGDESCGVDAIAAANGQLLRDDLEGWFRPDFSATGLILFNGPPRYPDYETRGVWEADPSTTPATQRLVLPAPLDLLVDGDRLPTWAPDGRHFVTARGIPGYRYDAAGLAIRSEAVVLHDRDDPEHPRVLLDVDHGAVSYAVDDFTWSPDGRWLLYALFEQPNAANVWWLDPQTGATGRLTHDGASISVDWRAREGDGPGPTGGDPCAASAPGVARAACYLAAIGDGIVPASALAPAGKRLLKRVVRSVATTRARVVQLAKTSPPSPRRVAKARKAVRKLGALLARATAQGVLAGADTGALAEMAAALTREIASL